LAPASTEHQAREDLQYLWTSDASQRWKSGVEFHHRGLLGRDITIYGDGAQTRSFCYVDDLIEGLVRLMKTPDKVTGPINLGNPEEFSIRELASTVIDLTGSRSCIDHRPLPPDDPRQRRPDISKARELMAWSPPTPLTEGLRRTIAYFEQLLSDPTLRAVLANSAPVGP
jgi:UDP-glucuronate decarboxylase